MRARRGWSRRSGRESGGLGGIEDFLREYSLSTKEGLALMVLAEALLRVPDCGDRRPADRGQALGRRLDPSRGEIDARCWSRPRPGRSASRRASSSRARRRRTSSRRSASGSACRRCAPRRGRRCGCSARISCSGRPSRRRWSAPRKAREFRYSYDMLGEGARTADGCGALFPELCARDRGDRHDAPAMRRLPDRPGISVKLSALHPRYEAVSRERVLTRAHAARAGARAARQSA